MVELLGFRINVFSSIKKINLNFLVLTLVEFLDPSFDVTDYVHDDVLPTVRAVASVCNRDMRKKISKLQLTYNEAFKQSPSERFLQGYKKMQFPTLALPVPLFVGTGAVSKISVTYLSFTVVFG